MSAMTEKERREAERRKRIRAASRAFEKKLGLGVSLDKGGCLRADDDGIETEVELGDEGGL